MPVCVINKHIHQANKAIVLKTAMYAHKLFENKDPLVDVYTSQTYPIPKNTSTPRIERCPIQFAGTHAVSGGTICYATRQIAHDVLERIAPPSQLDLYTIKWILVPINSRVFFHEECLSMLVDTFSILPDRY